RLLFARQVVTLGNTPPPPPRRRFALSQHHAETYIADATALVGDAAHLIHPLAGLGANLGFIDAAALAEVVERASADGIAIGQRSVLRRYERWRRGDNALALRMMRAFKEVFGSRRDGVRSMRGAALNLADSIPPLKNALARLATGVDGDLPALCRGEVG
ncbi:MAG: FAD-dependent monooxygenase, partial [bacterium]